MTVPDSEDQPVKKKGGRWQGVLLLLFAAVAGYASIISPLQQAYARAPKIQWGDEFAGFAPPAAVLGILILFFPSLTTNETFLLKSKDKLSIAGWLFLAALVAFGAGCYYLVNHQLDLLGYSDG